MNCREIERLLGPYRDRELDWERRAEVAAHQRHCEACCRPQSSLLRVTRPHRNCAPASRAASPTGASRMGDGFYWRLAWRLRRWSSDG